MVWLHGNANVGMNPSSIQMESEYCFAKVALLPNGSYFVGTVCPYEYLGCGDLPAVTVSCFGLVLLSHVWT